jgi:hypothetical protein
MTTTATPCMEATARLLREELDRYRRAAAMASDEQDVRTLRDIIRKTEKNLRRIERMCCARAPLELTGPLAAECCDGSRTPPTSAGASRPPSRRRKT